MESAYVRLFPSSSFGKTTFRAYSGRAFMTEVNKQADASGGDEAERERLLVEQLPQVRYIARRIHDRLPRHVLLEDLVHAGVVGLIDALQKFDGSKQVQFGSYAKFRIRGAILDSLRELDWSPRDLRRKARRLEEAHNQLRSSLGRNPSESELATELGIDLRGLQLLLGEISGLEIGSLRVESQRDGHEEDLCEYLPDDSEETPLFLCLRSEMKDLLTRAIAELPEKEQQVLALYYYEELTMKEVGVILGVGESRVSQIHSMAVIRLRTRLAESGNGHAGPAISRGASGGV
jgi:RNA polymerase sigma factor for flagellar operon FliA